MLSPHSRLGFAAEINMSLIPRLVYVGDSLLTCIADPDMPRVWLCAIFILVKISSRSTWLGVTEVLRLVVVKRDCGWVLNS